MDITRVYTHKTYREIGTVKLTVPDGEWKLDGKALPEASISHLAMFALQTLQDSYAGADSADNAKALFAKKYERLASGTLGTRSSGGVDEWTYVARIIMRAQVKAKLGAKSPEWKAFTGLADAEQAAKLDANIDANRAALTPAVAAEIFGRAAKRKRQAGLKVTVTL